MYLLQILDTLRMRGTVFLDDRSKSLLFIPQEEDSTVSSLPSEIPITRQGFTLLGCPIGPPSFCEASLLHQVEKIKATLGRLGDLGDSQLETTLLRSCLSLPKLSFTLRTCPPSHICHASSEFDQAVRECWWTHLPVVLAKGFTA